ncbi:hypothetical protein NBH00_19830 [Paraconexibacter antarcticus]|uniref:DUF4386 family protein n=1 Tax=Paraconexibacter antarcticus TaxID=2949664 RepID=A0ABY5DQ41_9ACTN|nr:hypothetical protein [Paraconexibacter antarcticus]UTI63580.1 hypothetical protein NBH00_19830 [Paraconexibacter antarcticus]
MSPRGPQFEPDDDRPTADLAWERRWGRPVGALAVLSVVGTIAAVPVAASDVAQKVHKQTDISLLTNSGLSGSGQVAAMIIRIAAILVLIPFAIFIHRAVRDRGEESYTKWIPVLGIIAFVIVAGSTSMGFFDQRDAGRMFLHDGPHTAARAKDLVHHLNRNTAAFLNIGGGFLFGLWISLTAVETMRVGLTTRFLGLFGLGAGFTTVIGAIIAFPISSALFIAWLGSLGLLAIGYWPGGRPLAWETGKAESPLETATGGQFGRRGSEPV